jgi:hypothetical protein
MKINLEVDIAYAIDFLSILEVKLSKLNDKISLNNFNDQKRFLSDQMDFNLFNQILNSEEYENLYETNKRIWESIDLIKTGNITAKHVDDLNYQRWILKNKLQSKFFNHTTSEQKTERKDYYSTFNFTRIIINRANKNSRKFKMLCRRIYLALFRQSAL